MSDFDSSRDKTSPGRAAPGIAFGHAMAGVAARCSQIEIALNNQNLSQVEHTFASAANLWLAGRSACRRLMAGDESAGPGAKAAIARLNETYLALLQLHSRVYKLIESLDVRMALDDVLIALGTAMAQPLSEAADPASDGTAMARPLSETADPADPASDARERERQ